MIPQKLQEILSDLDSLSEREERMEYLLELSGAYQPVPAEIASRPYPESALVPACQSEAYAFCKKEQNGKLSFFFAIENPQGISAKAFARVLSEGLKGSSKEEVLNLPTSIVTDIFGTSLTMGKGQGLMGMIFKVQELAKAQG